MVLAIYHTDSHNLRWSIRFLHPS